VTGKGNEKVKIGQNGKTNRAYPFKTTHLGAVELAKKYLEKRFISAC